MLLVLVCVIVSLVSCAAGAPAPAASLSHTPTFIGRGTDNIASALLQSYDGTDENVVFSPLGLNTLLAIFAEGARSDSRNEIASALEFPADQLAVRLGYQTVLKRLSEKFRDNVPEMKNWFYVYKNYSAENELKDVLQEYYLTEVKIVDRPEDFFNDQKTKVKVPSGLQGKPTDQLIDVEKEVEGIIQSSASGAPHKSDGEEANSNEKPHLFDSSNSQTTAETNEKKPVMEEAPPSVPLEENKKESISEEKTPLPTDDKKGTETLTNGEGGIEVNEVKDKPEEMMVAMQRSANRDQEDMNGMTDSVVKVNRNGSESQMVVFNGLYYKGDWDIQFAKSPAHDSHPFYKSNGEKVFVSTLHANGVFCTAECPELKSRAIEFKYVGGRYSLLLLVPHERDGLDHLVSDLVSHPISSIYSRLSEKLLDVNIPTFHINTISKPVSSSKKGGILNITKIFDPETSNLSGISSEGGLFVEELVQLVTFKVDSNYTEANFLTASIASTRSDIIEQFEVNQPFLFYLRDNIDGIVVVNGKVTDPTSTDDEFTKQSLRNTVHKIVP